MNTTSAQEILIKIISQDINTFNVMKGLPLMEDGFENWYQKYKYSGIFDPLYSGGVYSSIGIGIGSNLDFLDSSIYNIIGGVSSSECCPWDFYSIELDSRTGYCVNFKLICTVYSEAMPEIIKLSKDPKFEELINFI